MQSFTTPMVFIDSMLCFLAGYIIDKHGFFPFKITLQYNILIAKQEEATQFVQQVMVAFKQ